MELDREQRGVMQFMTTFYHYLNRDSAMQDEQGQELGRYSLEDNAVFMEEEYRAFYRLVVDVRMGGSQERAHVYHLATVLYKTMNYLEKEAHMEVPTEDAERNLEVEAKAALIVPYNILPLETPEDSNAPIMQLPQVRSAVGQIRNTTNLPYPREAAIECQPRPNWDIMDWLGFMFGFQKDNVRNQREHVVMLLASMTSRVAAEVSAAPGNIGPEVEARAVKALVNKTVENYVQWCTFFKMSPNLFPPEGRDHAQFDMICVCLYFLMWGEAANVRLLGECLCYIYFHLLKDVQVLLSPSAGSMPWATLKTKSGYAGQGGQRNGGPYAFLEEVIQPIHAVAWQEAENSQKGKAPYRTWRTYDDLNEFFWTSRCLELGWPWRLEHGFFAKPIPNKPRTDTIDCFPRFKGKRKSDDHKPLLPTGENSGGGEAKPVRQGDRCGKTLFVEHRTLWHVFRSFSRMWLFLAVALQAMIIIEWEGSITSEKTWSKMLSIMCTISGAQFLQVLVDTFMLIGAYGSLKVSHVVRLFCKFFVNLAWFLALTGAYYLRMNPGNSPSGLQRVLIILLTVVYLGLTAVGATLFRIPLFRNFIDREGCTRFFLIRIFKWWYQARLYVGRGMYETTFAYIKYSLFWIVLLILKIGVSYQYQVKPLISPTKTIISLDFDEAKCAIVYKWKDVISCRRDHVGTLLALWAPVVMVYLMDTMLWYSAMESIVGIVGGAKQRLGEVKFPFTTHTLSLLKS
ncbi:hypothetical protein CBR_g19493 [Chara braunii]|uniref:1,3-beta-glucan synthase component FKS1-like domain-containing protein n=1 Tax=Chara braunii TaxID=69332 RepID=A0A388KY40_CHABU|nr:hypothetical protein CBR_g19493 [Chara braunii]|eukprot:GBG74980.1 hypothetical protein CBR_g19493 [Chara braunii]